MASAITPGGPLHSIRSSGTIRAPSPSLWPRVALTEANEHYSVAEDISDSMKPDTTFESGPISASSSSM